MLSLVGAMGLPPIAHALEPDAVDAKFNQVTVLTPVSKSGELLPLKDVGMVAFFSPLAADLFAKEWRKRSGGEGEFRVAPLALTQFEAAYLTAKETEADLKKAIGLARSLRSYDRLKMRERQRLERLHALLNR